MAQQSTSYNYSVTLDYESVNLPPFQDILILSRKCPIGMIGISKCMGLIAPDGFEIIEVDDKTVEALLINKQLLKRMPIKTILDILSARVFPYLSPGEIVKVNFHVKITHSKIEGFLEQEDEN